MRSILGGTGYFSCFPLHFCAGNLRAAGKNWSIHACPMLSAVLYHRQLPANWHSDARRSVHFLKKNDTLWFVFTYSRSFVAFLTAGNIPVKATHREGQLSIICDTLERDTIYGGLSKKSSTWCWSFDSLTIHMTAWFLFCYSTYFLRA